MRWLWVVTILLLVPLPVQAEMPSEANIKAVADAYLMKKPAPSFGAGMSMAEAAKVQEQYTALIARDLGGVVGYKAGLTNPALQKRFGYDRPIRGTLYEKRRSARSSSCPTWCSIRRSSWTVRTCSASTSARDSASLETRFPCPPRPSRWRGSRTSPRLDTPDRPLYDAGTGEGDGSKFAVDT